MKRAAVFLFILGNTWWLLGFAIRLVIWPHQTGEYLTANWQAWTIGTTTFLDCSHAYLFWNGFFALLFVVGLCAVFGKSKFADKNG